MRHTKRAAFVAIAAVALTVAACGGDDDSSDTTEASTETTAASGSSDTTAASTETTAAGGTSAPGGSGEAVLGGLIPCDNQYDGKTVTLFSSIREHRGRAPRDGVRGVRGAHRHRHPARGQPRPRGRADHAGRGG